MILGFIGGLAIGFIIGALIYRNNVRHLEELLKAKRAELMRLYKMIDSIKRKW